MGFPPSGISIAGSHSTLRLNCILCFLQGSHDNIYIYIHIFLTLAKLESSVDNLACLFFSRGAEKWSMQLHTHAIFREKQQLMQPFLSDCCSLWRENIFPTFACKQTSRVSAAKLLTRILLQLRIHFNHGASIWLQDLDRN